jgi:hypothetical protein
VEWLWQIYWWAFLVVLSGNWLNQNGTFSSFFGLHGKLSTSCSSYSLCHCDVNGLSDWLDSSECVWSLEVFGEGVLNIRCAEWSKFKLWKMWGTWTLEELNKGDA